jgi:hypothetical protein
MMLAPGLSAQCDTRITTSFGLENCGVGMVERVKVDEGAPR